MTYRHISSKFKYDLLYKNKSPYQAGIDASTWYFYSDAALSSISNDFPNSKVIFLTRKSSSFINSLYLHNKRAGYDSRSSLRNAWSNGKSFNFMNLFYKCTFMTDYKKILARSFFIKNNLGEIINNDFMVVDIEDLFSGDTVIKEVVDFLGATFDENLKVPHDNKKSGVKSVFFNFIIKIMFKIKTRIGIYRSFGFYKRNLFYKNINIDKSDISILNEIDEFLDI